MSNPTDEEKLADDLSRMRELNGLYIGQLTISEIEMLDRLVDAGLAQRDYSGPAGFFCGLGKVKVLS